MPVTHSRLQVILRRETPPDWFTACVETVKMGAADAEWLWRRIRETPNAEDDDFLDKHKSEHPETWGSDGGGFGQHRNPAPICSCNPNAPE